MEHVPSIDIRRPEPNDLATVDAACRDHGFFLLEGHGLDDAIDRTCRAPRWFFSAPARVKEDVRRTEDQILGWHDRERTERRRDCKEAFDYMAPKGAIGDAQNRCPRELPEFREIMADFFEAFSHMAQETLNPVHAALSSPGEAAEIQHGSPVGNIVGNLADTVQVWRNEHYRASLHRLVPMTEQARFSIPYFWDPGLETLIHPIAAFGDEAPRYRPFTWRDFIQARNDDNVADPGAEDTQASHFRIV